MTANQRLEAFMAEYREALVNAAKLAAELETAEDRLKITYAQCFDSIQGSSAAKAEQVARTDDRYVQAINAIGDLRERAAIAKAHAKWMESRFDKWRTQSATRRTQIQAAEQ